MPLLLINIPYLPPTPNPHPLPPYPSAPHSPTSTQPPSPPQQQVLGLSKVQNSLVGSPEKRGVSGGQKKRVNIGMELVAWLGLGLGLGSGLANPNPSPNPNPNPRP